MDHLRLGGQRRPSPRLPAFCRTRRAAAKSVMVSVWSLRALRNLLLLLLALQLSTLLLLLAGPVPPRPGPVVMPLVMPQVDPISATEHTGSRGLAAGQFIPGAIALRHRSSLPSATFPSPSKP